MCYALREVQAGLTWQQQALGGEPKGQQMLLVPIELPGSALLQYCCRCCWQVHNRQFLWVVNHTEPFQVPQAPQMAAAGDAAAAAAAAAAANVAAAAAMGPLLLGCCCCWVRWFLFAALVLLLLSGLLLLLLTAGAAQAPHQIAGTVAALS
jgi:hypothetical protein